MKGVAYSVAASNVILNTVFMRMGGLHYSD